MTPIHALIFQKHAKMCVYIRRIKKPVELYYTFGEVRAAKKGWLGGHFFRTRVRRVRGAYAPAGVRGQRPRAVFSCFSEA